MTQLAASKRKRLRRRSVLTAAAVTGIAASFLALTFLRIGPAEQVDARLTGSSTSVVAAAPAERAELKDTEALAGKADAKAVAPEKSGTSNVAKPDVAGPAAAKSDQSTAVAPPEEKAPANVAAKPEAQQAEADSCAALSKSVDVFLQHFYAAHLERSPEGQVTDILDLDQYVLTHTVMIEDMLKPQLSLDTTKSVDVFLQHLYAAHLERSPEGQVTDALDLDQYVLTHTVMIEDMLKPIADGELGAC